MGNLTYKIVQTESGDWFLVETDYADRFVEDELNEEIDESMFSMYIGRPDSITITGYEYD